MFRSLSGWFFEIGRRLGWWLDTYLPKMRVGFEPGSRGARVLRWVYGPDATLCLGFGALAAKPFQRVANSDHPVARLFRGVLFGLLVLDVALLVLGPAGVAIHLKTSEPESLTWLQVVLISIAPVAVAVVVVVIAFAIILLAFFIRFLSEHLCPVVFYERERLNGGEI